jgi:hypothetical protein
MIFVLFICFFSYLSNTYQSIQEKSDIVWKNQRYQVILEYRSIFAPPFNWIKLIHDYIDNIDTNSNQYTNDDCKS